MKRKISLSLIILTLILLLPGCGGDLPPANYVPISYSETLELINISGPSVVHMDSTQSNYFLSYELVFKNISSKPVYTNEKHYIAYIGNEGNYDYYEQGDYVTDRSIPEQSKVNPGEYVWFRGTFDLYNAKFSVPIINHEEDIYITLALEESAYYHDYYGFENMHTAFKFRVATAIFD